MKINLFYKLRLYLLATIAVMAFVVSAPKDALACCACCIVTQHTSYHSDTQSNVSDAFESMMDALREFLYDQQPPTLDPDPNPQTFWHHSILPQLRSYTTQMTAVIVNYPAAIGAMMDGQNLQDKILRIQMLQAQAAKDHIPSVQMCEYATLTKSLAATKVAQTNFTRAMTLPHIRRGTLNSDVDINSETTLDRSPVDDLISRFDQFRSRYCVGTANGADHSGMLEGICNAPAATRKRNRDINFAQLVGSPRTISATLYPGSYGAAESVSQFEDLMALSNHLYNPEIELNMTDAELRVEADNSDRLDLVHSRSIAAIRNVAQFSFANYLAMKAPTDTQSNADLSVKPHIEGLLAAIGVSGDDSLPYFAKSGGALGLQETSPSYWAQMEVLTKTLYQNPRFFANLYDNPANVKRQQAAMKAVELMQERDIYETAIRMETLTSLWLDSVIQKNSLDTIDDYLNMQGSEE